MITTIQRITVRLSKEDKRILDELCEKLGESKTNIIKRALMIYKLKVDNNER